MLIVKIDSIKAKIKTIFYLLYYRNRFKCKKLISGENNHFKFLVYPQGRLYLGENFSFRDALDIRVNDNAACKIGDNVFFNRNCSITCQKKITIGNDCIFGQNLVMVDHDHIYKSTALKVRESGYKRDDIIIGNNVWFGADVTVLRGTVIGDNCVVAAGTVIKGEYAPDSLITQKRQIDIKKLK